MNHFLYCTEDGERAVNLTTAKVLLAMKNELKMLRKAALPAATLTPRNYDLSKDVNQMASMAKLIEVENKIKSERHYEEDLVSDKI